MFPRCPMVHGYAQEDAKINTIFNLAQLHTAKNNLQMMSRECPFTFKFDESTNRLDDKQYDGYV